MRWLVPLFLLGCSSSSTTSPPAPPAAALSTTPTPVVTTPPVADTDERCEPDASDVPDGQHDRYPFQDPKTELWGFTNKAGTIVIKATYPGVYPFRAGGIAAVIDGKTPFAFIDPSGKVIAKSYAFDNGPDYFQEGLARIVGADGNVGFIDDQGVIAIAPQFDKASPFCHGTAEVEKDGKRVTIRRTGAPVAP
jgi:hypothetical protein